MKDKNEVERMLNSFDIVAMLGLSIFILGILRINGISFTPLFILGVSTCALVFLLIELFKLRGIIKNSFQTVAFISLLGIPNIPYFQNLSMDEISLYSDSFSLFAMGLTLFLISRDGVKEVTNMIVSLTKTVNDFLKRN
ncbi:hypothetical protein E0485_17405 [Paenibacillus albiflavus]|uniref:Uncharacterized protein n=1 Tax=Paenibacillus albiflavus TaxID=2545760 RepID=A0A4V2WNG8_9BACL|nr:hypothetical protein [Paenibacillus albiflavus]TCZ75382.1 hypothetical protein E0485_17405 [Paenibacillus albiflavus]